MHDWQETPALETPAPVHSPGPAHLIPQYFRGLWDLHLHPFRFFSKLPERPGIAGPLAFALITHWLGSALEFLWQTAMGKGGNGSGTFDQVFNLLRDHMDDFGVENLGRGVWIEETRDALSKWFWSAGPVVADPFITLISVLGTASIVYMGARIFITPGRLGARYDITFDSALAIVCFGMAPSILVGLPVLGGFISWGYVIVVTVIGARVVYRIDTGRAIVVALFPKLLVLGSIALIFALFAALIIKLAAF